MTENSHEKVADLSIRERAENLEDTTYTDGSIFDNLTAAATIDSSKFLGRYATVMDAAMRAIFVGWGLPKQ